MRSLFSQLVYGYSASGFHCLDTHDKMPFETHFMHEHSVDGGGPMRDTLSSVCEELMSDYLPLLRKTANNRSNLEPETDCF